MAAKNLTRRGRPPVDLTGQVFGQLTVICQVGKHSSGHILWQCQCICGNIWVAASDCLRKGATKSCGCLAKRKTPASGPRYKHGMVKSSEYCAWLNMLARCFNPGRTEFPNYGGRGITVCERWQNSFQAFYEDMGPRPGKGFSLDRINNEGNYCKENCRWTTSKVQLRNKRNTQILSYNGRSQPLMTWAEELGLNRSTLFYRLKLGWSVERALTEPV